MKEKEKRVQQRREHRQKEFDAYKKNYTEEEREMVSNTVDQILGVLYKMDTQKDKLKEEVLIAVVSSWMEHYSPAPEYIKYFANRINRDPEIEDWE